MKARNLMSKDVASCRPEDPMAAAARIMWERDCGIVPVVDGEGHPLGVVTDRDLCMASLTRNEPLSRMVVRDAMARDIVTCREDDDEEEIHEAMRKRQVRRVPVLDEDGRLAGMISLNDLALAAAGKGGAAEKRQREVARTAAEISRHREVAAAV